MGGAASQPGLAVGGAASQPVDNETVACNWLQSHYECQPASASAMTRTELYKRYVSACSVCGLQQIVSPTTFATCVRYDILSCGNKPLLFLDICEVDLVM